MKPLLLIYRLGRGMREKESGGLYGLVARAAWLGVPAVVVSVAVFYYVIGDAVYYRYFSPEPPADGVPRGTIPLIPGVTVPLDINLLIILFSIGVAVLVHELGHAVSAVSLGIRVKDSGLILLGFIPAAFVEVDEEAFGRARWRDKVRVLSAGVLGNIVLAVAVLSLMPLAPVPEPDGVRIESVAPDSPADRAGLRRGDVVVSVNNVRVESVQDFLRVLRELGVFDPETVAEVSLRVSRDGQLVDVVVAKTAMENRLGVTVRNYYESGDLPALLVLAGLQSLVNISLALAVINAAPIVIPTPWGVIASDGAQIARETLATLIGEKNSNIVASVLGVANLLLIVSVITLHPLRFLP